MNTSAEHDHDHGQDHAHADTGRRGGGHDHAHAHAPQRFDRAFAIGIALNVGFVAVEAF